MDRFRVAPVTWCLTGINVLLFVLETVAGGSTSTRVALLFGAQATPYLLAGQVWRLVTAMFLHFGVLHLGCNMISLYHLGPPLERVYGKGRYLAVYFGAGIIGNLTTWLLEMRSGEYAVSAGASGAIFGLFGAYLALALIPDMRRFLSLRGIVITLVLNIAHGLTYSGVNMAAHAGGLSGGFVIASVMVLVWRCHNRAVRENNRLQDTSGYPRE